MTHENGAYDKVAGRCPMGCGETLFLGDGGYVTCSWIECPDPTAADRVLDSPTEKATVRVTFWAHHVEYPMTKSEAERVMGFIVEDVMGLPSINGPEASRRRAER